MGLFKKKEEAKETTAQALLLYTEQTPNPETLKFVTNRMLYRGTADFPDRETAREWSPLAAALFELPYVKGVYISNNFVTVTKEPNYDWSDLMIKLKEFIKTYLVEEKGEIVKDGYFEAMAERQARIGAGMEYSEKDAEMVKKIKELLDKYVKPAVEMDGGNIEFKSYRDGVVTVLMQGSCSGCPSSTMTLKAGIEGMLKRMMPEIKEVIAEAG